MVYTHGPIEEMPREEIDRMLTAAPYGRLGLAFENEAYVVPVSHYYDGHSIRFHIAREGKKTTYLQANPQACYEVDEVTGEGWRSVICYGPVSLSDSLEAKREFFQLVSGQPPSDDTLLQLPVLIGTMTLEEVTGRKRSATPA